MRFLGLSVSAENVLQDRRGQRIRVWHRNLSDGAVLLIFHLDTFYQPLLCPLKAGCGNAITQ